MNRNDFQSTVIEIEALLTALDLSLRHASNMIGQFMNFELDDNDNILSDVSLNREALDELSFQSRKLSSKSDILQSKVSELRKQFNS